MSKNLKVKPPVWFWIVSALALLWNLGGLMAYIMDVFMRDLIMVEFTESQKSIFENQPTWLTGVYAIAVLGGTFGCIALLLRKKWAKMLFLVSLLSVVIRTAYYFFMTNSTEVFDIVQGTIMPIMVIVIAGLLCILSIVASDRKWLT